VAELRRREKLWIRLQRTRIKAALEHDVKTKVTLAHQLRQVRRREARKEVKRFAAIERAQVEAASSVGNANTTRESAISSAIKTPILGNPGAQAQSAALGEA
jgi:hypothetical protein